MIDITKKTEAIEIKGIVVHRVNKKAGDTHTTITEANSLLSVTENEKIFIYDTNAVYHKKSNPIYGTFEKNTANPKDFKHLLKSYLDGDIDYLSFTKLAVKLFQSEISRSAPATGGFLIFAHYIHKTSGTNNLLIFTTNNQDGFAINETALTIEGIKTIDMSKVDVACKINITKWQEIVDLKDDTGDNTYLSFIKGNKDISVYFMTFIGCSDKSSSKSSSEKLLKSISEYLDKIGVDREEKIKRKSAIYAYCDECLGNNSGIQLSVVSGLIDTDNPDNFYDFATEEGKELSSVISGNITVLKRLKSIYYKDKNIIISFDKKLLAKSVIYNKEKNWLTFKDIPQSLIDQLGND